MWKFEHVFNHIFQCNHWEFESMSSLNSHEFRLQYDATQSLWQARFKDQNLFLQELESSLSSFHWFLKHEISLIQNDDYVSQSMYESNEKRMTGEIVDQSKLQIFSISITRSNLDIFQWLLKHWIQLIQNYNNVFQSMKSSQSACVFIRRNIQRSSYLKISSNFYIRSFSSMIECEVKNFKMQVQVLWWSLKLSSLFRFLSREDHLFHFIFLNFYVSLVLMRTCCNYENSQCAWIDSNEKRWWQMRVYEKSITSCSRYLQSRLLK